MLKRIDVTAFVDWQSQMFNARQLAEQRPERRAEKTMTYVLNTVAEVLLETGAADIFSVELRLYHGWYRGLTPTDNRKSVEAVLVGDTSRGTVEKVRFHQTQPFGDTLLEAYEHRKHPRLKIHLPDTLRQDLDGDGRLREKMVDSALSCDVLQSAR